MTFLNFFHLTSSLVVGWDREFWDREFCQKEYLRNVFFLVFGIDLLAETAAAAAARRESIIW